MRKTLLCTAMLAALGLCGPAHALATWNFTYKGFENAETGVFDANKTLSGSFSASDTNGDRIISLAEVTGFSVGGYTYLGSDGCVGSTSPYIQCRVDSFSYALTGQLDFALRRWGNDEAFSGWGGHITTGDNFHNYSYNYFGDWSESYNWTEQTSFTISPPPLPVPEPAAILLLPVGLVMLMASTRRRQKVSM